MNRLKIDTSLNNYIMTKKKEEEKIHIHKVAQTQNCSYEKIYQRHGPDIDENKMITVSVINT